ncbi:hypothetical protein LXL04_029683 [Taraxacum kok-saghyz]
MTRASWRVRADMAEIDLKQRYAGHPSIFSICLHHGGEFTKYPGRKYIKGKENFVDLLHIDKFSIHDLDDIVEYFDYVEDGRLMFDRFLIPLSSLDYGLYALASDQDSQDHLNHNLDEQGDFFLDWYETDIVVDSQPKGVEDSQSEAGFEKDKGKGVDDSQLNEVFEQDNGKGVDDSQVNEVFEQDNGKGADDSQLNEVFEQDNGKGVDESQADEGVDSDSDDSDFIVDEEDMLDTSQPVIPEESQCEEPAVEVMNNDELVSGSSSDDGETNIRKKSIRKIQRAHENENALVSDPFYLFQTFSSAEEVKEKVKEHAIETRR